MAPRPGNNPRTKATPGLLLPAPRGTAAAGGVVTGVGPGGGAEAPCPITVARQSSQYSTSRTGREHTAHIGLPQFLQYPVASTSVWTAHFIEISLRSKPH